uniref:Uncharacterized protein n=1 Tax=Kalanchoe fedtschenkoi TaxID=63787 RepID=A0A7N0TJA1_KALFE
MNRRTRSIPNPADSFHRYLKPGALARLRDSRITATSYRFHNIPSFSAPLPASPSGNQLQIQASPRFSGRVSGPRCPQRKKLVAARSVCYFMPSSPLLVAPPVDETSDSVAVELFGTDIAAH